MTLTYYDPSLTKVKVKLYSKNWGRMSHSSAICMRSRQMDRQMLPNLSATWSITNSMMFNFPNPSDCMIERTSHVKPTLSVRDSSPGQELGFPVYHRVHRMSLAFTLESKVIPEAVLFSYNYS